MPMPCRAGGGVVVGFLTSIGSCSIERSLETRTRYRLYFFRIQFVPRFVPRFWSGYPPLLRFAGSGLTPTPAVNVKPCSARSPFEKAPLPARPGFRLSVKGRGGQGFKIDAIYQACFLRFAICVPCLQDGFWQLSGFARFWASLAWWASSNFG